MRRSLCTNSLLCIMLIAGCSTTYKLRTPEEFNKKNGEHEAIVHFKDGVAICGKQIRAEKQRVCLINTENDSSLCAPVRELRSIEHVDRVNGGIFGFFIGMVSGVGGGLGVASTIDAHGSDQRGLSLLAGALVGGAFGAVSGAIWGVAYGFRTVYEFPSDSTRSARR
jgi:hypothetical protein